MLSTFEKLMLGGVVTAGVTLGAVGTALARGVRSPLRRRTFVMPRNVGVPFSELGGGVVPHWPVATQHSKRGIVSYTDINGEVHGNWARQFHALRENGARWHVGVDLFGNDGDPVLAIADGIVVSAQTFYSGTDAVLVEHDGMVALYGEVESGSWKQFGVQVGKRVRRGEPLARVGCMQESDGDCTSHMLHFEAYAPGTRKNHRWYAGDPPPPQLRDPTLVLLDAAQGEGH